VPTTEEVLDHHMKVLANGDIAALMEDYAEDAVLIAGPEPAKGKAAVEGFFGAVAANGGISVTEDVRVVEGDFAYIVWHSDQIPFGTDTFVVRDGKIVLQTVALKF
jgi:ketosteroid isomerase-like protein